MVRACLECAQHSARFFFQHFPFDFFPLHTNTREKSQMCGCSCSEADGQCLEFGCCADGSGRTAAASTRAPLCYFCVLFLCSAAVPLF